MNQNFKQKLRKIVRNIEVAIRTRWAGLWRVRGLWFKSIYGEAKADSLISSKKLFFVHGSGRSGTQMLSGLLSIDPKVMVTHEPAFYEDRITRNMARVNANLTDEYIKDFRRYVIYRLLAHNQSTLIYGEVTGTLRYHASTLHKLFPNAQALILARDGRDVVRSIMQREFYTANSNPDGDTSPLPGGAYYERWPEMTRFEKICWLWADSYLELFNVLPGTRIIYFEKIVSDYDYCTDEVFSLLGVNISFDDWKMHISKKSANATTAHSFPHWEKWSDQHKKDFDRICGPVMRRLGYEYKWL